jgi:hypothetical protein
MYKFEFKICNDVTEIYVRRRSGELYTILIDTEDLSKLKGYSIGINDKPNGRFMVRVTNGYRTEQPITNVLTNCPFDKIVDHRDRNPANNIKTNFRFLTVAENNQNMSLGKNNTSGVRGVSFDAARNKWFVAIKGKTVGRFELYDEAVTAATEYRKQHMPLSL